MNTPTFKSVKSYSKSIRRSIAWYSGRIAAISPPPPPPEHPVASGRVAQERTHISWSVFYRIGLICPWWPRQSSPLKHHSPILSRITNRRDDGYHIRIGIMTIRWRQALSIRWRLKTQRQRIPDLGSLSSSLLIGKAWPERYMWVDQNVRCFGSWHSWLYKRDQC